MKKSTQNTCICVIIAVLAGIAAVIMAYFGLLPGLFATVDFAVRFAAAALLVLFVMAALSGCHCMRKLFIALCRYGKCLAFSLVGTLLSGLMLLAIDVLCAPMALALVVLFAFTMLFAMALLAFGLAIYTMATLGCPQPCKKPVHHDCDDNEEDYDNCKF